MAGAASCIALACAGGGPRGIIAPFAGVNRNELVMGGGGPPTILRDTAAEYGLFAMVMGPRFAVNNSVFVTDPNSTEVTGDMFMLNLYGPPSRRLTWNAGAGYTWIDIVTGGPPITVSAPLLKAGIVWRPRHGLSVNPYVALSSERVDTGAALSEYDSMLYGVTVNHRWRMLQTTFKYYLENNDDLGELLHTVRVRMTLAFRESFALFLRAEHMEHSLTTDDGMVVGAAFVF